MNEKKAIFLDRDGTINEDVGDLYSQDKLKFIPRAINALKILQQKYMLFIITNQEGIEKGRFSQKDFFKFNEYYMNYLESCGIRITNLYVCPHVKETKCQCRKPNTYFIRKIENEYNINLNNSYTIGDHPHDILMGKNVETKTVYLMTGHGLKHKEDIKDINRPDYIAEDLYNAAKWILSDNK